ncbi:MAG: recombination protein RecR [Clostridiales bacterium]|nr:recombination protein RecR [Clostridiales bacterium]
MKNYIEPIARLIGAFQKLPGVGQKTAQRYALKVVNMSDTEVKEFAECLVNVKNKVKYCSVCGNFTESDPCDLCKTRNGKTICVVKDPKDVLSIERIRDFDGVYHVLHGVLNPMEGIGPNDIRIKELVSRVGANDVQEVIVATNPDVEGEATAMYIAKLLKPLGVKVTRIAQGISIGSDLEYADEVTLSRAIEDRREL